MIKPSPTRGNGIFVRIQMLCQTRGEFVDKRHCTIYSRDLPVDKFVDIVGKTRNCSFPLLVHTEQYEKV